MMRHTVFENVIPLEVCDHIKDFFDSREDLHIKKPNNPNVIKINSPWTHLKDVLDPILSNYFKTVNGQGGNIYKHSNLYTTHVDSEEPWQLINCLLPIHLPDPTVDQRFVVFDQWVDNGFGQTWYGDRDDLEYDFDRNKILQSTPFTDNRVYDKTDKDIDTDFYNNFLENGKHKPKYFKGLTGTAYSFKPGNLILFNSNNLHSTGSLKGPWKMGLHINFEGTLTELLR
jgi:hypothetical protein